MKLTNTIGFQCANAFAKLLVEHPELNQNGYALHRLKGMAMTLKGYESLHPFMFNGAMYVD